MTQEQKTEMAQLRDFGWSFGQIGEKFKISRQRVHQIIDIKEKKRKPIPYEIVLRRDDYKCQICGLPYNSKKPRLHNIHHIDGDPSHVGESVNNWKNNLILLCRNCHATIHCLFDKNIAEKYKNKYLKILKDKNLNTNIVI